MSLVTESEITVNGIDFIVEHCEEGSMERIIVRTPLDKIVGDAIVQHNSESVTANIFDGVEKITESYDYWEFNEEDKEEAVKELATWMSSIV